MIRPERERKAHVDAYAEEIKFKLLVMILIWLAVVLL